MFPTKFSGEKNMKTRFAGQVARLAMFILVSFLCVQPSQADEKELLLATTTSTDNTGLLDYLVPMFTKASGIEVKWVATGTGKALKLGENCDADVLMVHAPAAEMEYVKAGFGIKRREIMYNDFVIIGPDANPAGVSKSEVCSSLKAITAKKAVFASRGDNSGTNKKELSLWENCNIPVPQQEEWYMQTGQGMLATINIAAERGGYTMTDRGTYIKYEANHNGNPPLKILVEGDSSLLNQYSVMEVSPERCPKAKNEMAKEFGDWLVSKEGQEAIGNFRLMDKQLFTPNASGM
jgi:tungstate transport system substrate-binding protein